jgi:hypothetical protein
MRHQQDKPREEQQAQDAELDIRTTLQELVPSVQVLCERHQRHKQCGEDEDGTAAKHATFAQTLGPFRVLTSSIKTAAQSPTTRFPALLA